MIDRTKLENSFEFVVTAGARARQLLNGSVPRVEVGEHKKTTIAQREVITRAVEKVQNPGNPRNAVNAGDPGNPGSPGSPGSSVKADTVGNGRPANG